MSSVAVVIGTLRINFKKIKKNNCFVFQYTGLVLQAAKRLQGNIYIEPLENVR